MALQLVQTQASARERNLDSILVEMYALQSALVADLGFIRENWPEFNEKQYRLQEHIKEIRQLLLARKL